MSSGGVSEFQGFENIPSDGEVTVPKELLGEGDRQLRTSVDVALLQFVVSAHEVRVEREALRQIVEVLRLDDVEPFRLSFHLLERFQSLVFWRIVVGEVSFPVLIIVINDGLSFLVALAVGVAQGEVRRVEWHWFATLIVRFPVGEREVLVLRQRFCNGSEGVAGTTFQFVECVLQKHICVERIVLRRDSLITVGVVERHVHLPLHREQFP